MSCFWLHPRVFSISCNFLGGKIQNAWLFECRSDLQIAFILQLWLLQRIGLMRLVFLSGQFLILAPWSIQQEGPHFIFVFLMRRGAKSEKVSSMLTFVSNHQTLHPHSHTVMQTDMVLFTTLISQFLSQKESHHETPSMKNHPHSKSQILKSAQKWQYYNPLFI